MFEFPRAVVGDDEEMVLSDPETLSENTLLLPYAGRLIRADDRLSWTMILDELRVLIQYSLPLIATFLLQMTYTITPTILLGRLGTAELAAVTLAGSFMMLTGSSIQMGAATALDTFCSQAFTGRKDRPYEVGVHLQRGLIFSAAVYIPVSVLWCNARHVLLWLHQTPEEAKMAQQVIYVAAFAAPGSIVFDYMKRYFQGQGIMHASTYALMLMAPIGVGLMFALINNTGRWGIGMYGAPVAQFIIYWCKVLFLVAYGRYVAGGECWGGWSWEAMYGWKKFFRLALPGIAVVCSSLWALELLNLAAGSFGSQALSAQAIALQCCFLGLVIHFGKCWMI